MNLREKIENNLVFWLLGTMLTGFLAGIGTYKAILEIAQLEVIPRSKLEQIQAPSLEDTPPVPSSRITPAGDSSKVDRSVPMREVMPPTPSQKRKGTDSDRGSQPPPELSNSQTSGISGSPESVAEIELPASEPVAKDELEISIAMPPFPDRFDSVRPGMRLSEAQLILPGGRISVSGYVTAEIDSYFFDRIQFIASGDENDPEIRNVVFYFRSEDARKIAVSSLLKKFGSIPHRSQLLGQKLIWPDVNGFKLQVDDQYWVSLKSD